MGKPGIQFLIIGAILVVVGFLFQDGLAAAGGDTLFLAVVVIGAAVAILGAVQLLTGGEKEEEGAEKMPLGNEVLLKVLAQGTRADTNIHEDEVAEVQRIFNELTGDEVSAAEIRVAALGEHYEDKSLRKYLSGVADQLNRDEKLRIAKALGQVIKADERISPNETGFFNQVVEALKLSPSDVADF